MALRANPPRRDACVMADEPLPSETGQPRERRTRNRRAHVHFALSRPNQVLSTFLLAGATALVGWTIFLGLSLPPRYDAGHWNVLWTGFDVGLLCVFAYGAWAAWFRRQILATTAIVAGTLLLCDAWFDIVTSIGHRDQWLTLLTGLAGELPLAAFFFWLYRWIVLNTLTALHQQIGDAPPPRRLRDALIVEVTGRPAETGRTPAPPDGDRHAGIR
jgi:hypothetical protein